MLARFLIWFLFMVVVWRAVRGLLAGIVQGASAPPPEIRATPEKGEQMVRDPVCGTFVLPSRSLAINDRSGTHHFCSDACRAKFRSR